MKVIARNRDPGAAQVAHEPAVGLDILVPPRQPELDRRRLVGCLDRGVDAKAVAGAAFLSAADELERGFFGAELEPGPADSDLLQEEKVLVGDEAGVDLSHDLNVRGVVLGDGAVGRFAHGVREGFPRESRRDPRRAREKSRLENSAPGDGSGKPGALVCILSHRY